MINQQLLDYIKAQLQRGNSPDSLKTALVAQGWPAVQVDEALRAAGVQAPVKSKKKLIILGIVIGLLVLGGISVPAIMTVMILNPAPLLAQSRDSARISDLATLQSAIALYKEDGHVVCKQSGVYYSTDGTRTIDGAGWLPINFNDISAGPPFGNLPVDPVNDTKYRYVFACNAATQGWELDAVLESEKYNKTLNLPGEDGGNNPQVYETGADLNVLN